MYDPRPPGGSKGGKSPPKPPTEPKKKFNAAPPGKNPNNRRDFDDSDDDDFDHNKERKVVRGVKNSKRQKSDVSEEDAFGEDRLNNYEGEEFDTNRKRHDLKGYKNDMHREKKKDEKKADRVRAKLKGEIPLKSNNFLGRRMSDLVRGEDPDLPNLDDILFNPDHAKYEEQTADGCWDAVVLTYHRKMSEKKMIPRAILCGLAVSLLWASSASACRAFIGAVVPLPSYTQIERNILQLENETDEVSFLYSSCVDRAFFDCNSSYVSGRDLELARVKAVQDANLALLEQHDDTKNQCSQNYNLMLAKLSELSQASPPLNFANSPADSPPATVDCSDLAQVAEDQLQAALAVQTAEQSGAAASSTITTYQDQLDERVAYDEAYKRNISNGYADRSEALRANLFSSDDLRAQTETSFLELEACLTNEAVINEATGETVLCSETGLLGLTEALFGSAGQDYEQLAAQAQAYLNTVNGFVADVNRLKSFTSLVPPDLVPLFNIDAPDLGGIQANFFGGLEGLGISQEQFDQLVRSGLDAYNGDLDGANSQLDALDAEIAQRQQAFLDDMDAEFTPPGVDVQLNNDAEAAKITSARLGSVVEQDLGAIGLEETEIPQISNVSSNAQQNAISKLNGIAERSLDVFTYSDSIFTDLETGLYQVFNLVLLFDSIWRIMTSVLLVKKYWSISAIGTPPADIRSDKGALFKERESVLQKVAKFLANPLVTMIYTLVVLMVLSFAFYFAYIPLFDLFVEGCTENDARAILVDETAEGTMIFRNMYTTSFSIAVADGDEKVSTLVDRLNLERQLSCRDFFEASNTERTSQEETFNQLEAEMDILNERYQLFNGCIDWAEVDALFAANRRGVQPLAFSFFDGFGAEECANPLQPIDTTENALHSCAAIPACDFNCEPSLVKLQNANHDAACTSEYAGHAYFLTFLFVSVMYVCLNRARHYFLRGLLGMFWPTICLDIHSYLVSCTERGTIIPPKEVDEGEPFKDVIKVALDKALKKFTRSGYMDMFFAISINVPWIIFLYVTTSGIDYKSIDLE